MKIGIITFHYAYNHGAVLQCMALYRTLKRMGYEVDVINYVPEDFAKYEISFLRGWGIKRGMFFKNIPKKFIKARYGKAIQRVFDQFRAEHLSFSPFCQTPDEISKVVKAYDLLVTGSDQVWRFSEDGLWFLAVGEEFKGKKVSYAPCCGLTRHPKKFYPLVKQWLSDFDFISVRNTFSRKIIREASGFDAEIVADPTLLVDLSDLALRPDELRHDEYILMYMLGDEIKGGHQQVLGAIKEQFGALPVVAVVSSAHKPQRFPWADQVLYTAGPAEWLYLIGHATFVYTDSFHGALFSINYKQPFCVYYSEEDRAARLLDLAERYKLEAFVSKNAEDAVRKIGCGSFGFKDVSEEIEQHVGLSKDFLKKALEG